MEKQLGIKHLGVVTRWSKFLGCVIFAQNPPVWGGRADVRKSSDDLDYLLRLGQAVARDMQPKKWVYRRKSNAHR